MLDAAEIIAIARAIPDDWCVMIEPPYGQVSIGPLAGRKRFHRCWVASKHLGRITRDDGLRHIGARAV